MSDTVTKSPEGTHRGQVAPDEIERELGSMWKPIMEEGEGGASRVVLGNVIWAGDSSYLDRIQRVIGEVVPRYPCRLFLLSYDADDDSTELTAAISAQCFRPNKSGPPVCCEMIRMRFGPKAARHLAGAVAPLLLPDLQTVLLEVFGGRKPAEIGRLREYADRTIGLSSQSDKPAEAMRDLASINHAYDLSWFRAAPIREQMAAYFDAPGGSFDLDAISQVEIGIVNRKVDAYLPATIASLFAGWLGWRLGWEAAGSSEEGFFFRRGYRLVKVVVKTACERTGPVRSNISHIAMRDSRGNQFRMDMPPEGGVMDLWCGDEEAGPHERHILLSELSEAKAIGTALNLSTRSAHFRAAAELAIPLLEYLTTEKGKS